MATHADIIILLEDGTYLLADCASDGFPSGVGVTLLTHYNDTAKIMELIQIGAFSPLDETPALTREYNLRDLENEPTDMPAKIAEGKLGSRYTYGPYAGYPGEYRYLWDGDRWWYQTHQEDDDAYGKYERGEDPLLTKWIHLKNAICPITDQYIHPVSHG